jgi:hypothetical protein
MIYHLACSLLLLGSVGCATQRCDYKQPIGQCEASIQAKEHQLNIATQPGACTEVTVQVGEDCVGKDDQCKRTAYTVSQRAPRGMIYNVADGDTSVDIKACTAYRDLLSPPQTQK